MKRNSKTLVAALIIVATTAAFMVGCSKKEDPSNAVVKQSEATLARIMDFRHQLEMAKTNPDERTVSYMSIADAVWNLEALINFAYAYPDDSYAETICCDTILYLPISENDSVTTRDLAVFYGQMFDAVLAIFHRVDLNNKQFLIFDLEAGNLHDNFQIIELHFVQGSVRGDSQDPNPWQMWEPFEDGSPWYYGNDKGRLDGSFHDEMDAADTLSRMLNAMLVQKAPGGTSYIYTNIIMKELSVGDHIEFSSNSYPGCGQYCEFYIENPSGNDYWLGTDHMNFYYFGERHLVMNVLPNYGSNIVPSTHHLINISIFDDSQSSTIWHHTQAIYGHRDGVDENDFIKGDL